MYNKKNNFLDDFLKERKMSRRILKEIFQNIKLKRKSQLSEEEIN